MNTTKKRFKTLYYNKTLNNSSFELNINPLEVISMWLREITKQNIIEILLLPLIFIVIFIAGITIFITFDLDNYMFFAGWCFASAGILMVIVVIYSYFYLKSRE